MNHADIQELLRSTVARKLKVPPETLDPHRPLDEYGLDSLELVNLSGEIEEVFSMRIDPTALWDHLTMWELSSHLAKLSGTELDLSESEEHIDMLLTKLGAKNE